MIKPGWYIFNYHNIDHKENPLTFHIGGTIKPDVFYNHLKRMSELGQLISVSEGWELFLNGQKIDKPLFSIWFDDGFRGIRTNALPICEQFGITAATSINSRFMLRQEMFWRCKLSTIIHFGYSPFLRESLEQEFSNVTENLKLWTLENFSTNVLNIIDQIYNKITSEDFRIKSFNIFDDTEGIEYLHKKGWLICNHTSAHYPIPIGENWSFMEEQFQECETALKEYLGKYSFWVLPFDYGELRKRFSETIPLNSYDNRVIVRVRNRCPNIAKPVQLDRFIAPNSNDFTYLVSDKKDFFRKSVSLVRRITKKLNIKSR